MQYTGIGAEGAPPHLQTLATALARQLAAAGYLLRTGADSDMDAAFERGAADGRKEVLLAWRGYKGHKSSLFGASEIAMSMAAAQMPAWAKLGTPAKWQHACCVHQVLGSNLSAPSSFLVLWSADGMESKRLRTPRSGVIATAVAVAEKHRIPIFNLAKASSIKRLYAYLKAAGVTLPVQEAEKQDMQGSLF